MGTVRMSLRTLSALLMALAALLFVLVEPAEGATPPPPSPASAELSTTVAAPGAVATIDVEPCPTVGAQVELISVEQVEELLEGVWVQCDGPQSSREGEIGVEVVGDSFHRIYEGTDGTLIRASGAEQEGTLTVTDMTAWNGPGSYQVTFAYLSWGSTMTEADFFTDPTALRLGATTYRLWEGAAPVDGVPPGTGAEPCDLLADPVVPATVEDVKQRLIGTWILCNGPSGVTNKPGQVGFQVIGDRVHRVYEDTDGTLIRASGGDEEGTVSATAQAAGPGFEYYVTLDFVGPSSISFPAAFFDRPDAIRFTEIMNIADYIRWDGPEPVPGIPPGTGTDPCDALGDAVIPASAGEVAELLTGTWVSCSGGQPAGPSQEGQIGWQFGDGHVNMIFQDTDGGLIRADGADREGTVTVLDIPVSPDSYQVDLHILGDGLAPVPATFFDDGRILRFGDTDLYRWDGPEPVPGDPPGLGDGPCDVLRGIAVPTTVEEVESRLAGAWVLCNGSWNLGGAASGPVGFEVVDGAVYQLFDDGEGGVIRSDAPEHLGTAVVVSVTPAAQSSQVDFNWQAGSGIGLAAFFDDPDAFRYTSFAGVADYLRWTGPTMPEPPEPPTCHHPHHYHQGHAWGRWHHRRWAHAPWDPSRGQSWDAWRLRHWPTPGRVTPPWWDELR